MRQTLQQPKNMTLVLPNTLVNNTVADADEVMDNFNELLNFCNSIADSSGWILVSDSWVYASADSPTFTITVPSGAASLYSVGMKIKLTQTTVKYFIITAVADTVLTVYGGTDYTLINAAISAISISTQKNPYGFPVNPLKWTVEITDTSNRTQATPTQNVWYNLGSVSGSLPIGAWNVFFSVATQVTSSSSSTGDIICTLSDANNSESDAMFSFCFFHQSTGATAINHMVTMNRQKTILLSVKTTKYVNTRTTGTVATALFNRGDVSATTIRAICAYL